jgi:hypothetical protein
MTRPIPTQSRLQKLVGFKTIDRYGDVLQWRWGPVVYTRVGSAILIDLGALCVGRATGFDMIELRWRGETIYERY